MIGASLGPIGWYGLAVGAILLIKLALSIPRPAGRRPQAQEPGGLTVAAIVTVYNEATASLTHCLASLLAQTRRLDIIHVVDDGSTEGDYARIREWFLRECRRSGIHATWTRTPNRGKRHALAEGVQASQNADVYCCVDSDTLLDCHALAEALRPFSRHRVHAVTALVLARNRRRNLLTRLIDMRYVNAFLGERVAYSRLGSVLCVCGSLALYRGWIVRAHLNDFLSQQFLGRPATAGDDRRLTYYALQYGEAVIQPAAVAWTDVPERLGHYARQQVRWTKSFVREGLLMFATLQVRKVAWWLNLIELVTWLAFTTALLVAMGVMILHPYGPLIAIFYAGYVCAAAWLRSVHYLRGAAGVPLPDRCATFVAAPLYALLNLGLLIPLRLWAVATLRDTSWGTRAEVEVR